VLGNTNAIGSLLEPSTSIASTIASEFGEAAADMHRSALLGLGFLLFAVTFFVLAIAKLMLLSLKRREGK
jgi:phosphate transport system permease protein